MSRKGRFGKYGEVKRMSRLRASRISKLARLDPKTFLRRKKRRRSRIRGEE